MIAFFMTFLGLATSVMKIKDFTPFSGVGKLIYKASKYCVSVIKRTRSSQFYHPVEQVVKFDPTFLLLFCGVLITSLVIHSLGDSVALVLGRIGSTLLLLGSGELFRGIWVGIGAALLGALGFYLIMMLFMFLNNLFELFPRVSAWASKRVRPLLSIVEATRCPPNWSFFVLYIILSILYSAVARTFV